MGKVLMAVLSDSNATQSWPAGDEVCLGEGPESLAKRCFIVVRAETAGDHRHLLGASWEA